MTAAKRKKSLIIAIDGPAGSGKSTTAKRLAAKLKLPYIDTGAMYRAVTLQGDRESALKNPKRLAEITKQAKIHFSKSLRAPQKVFLNGENVTRKIRSAKLTRQVSGVAKIREVRRAMVEKQRQLTYKGGGVMEGRDIGSVVLPNADYKFYFTANARVRAKRRQKDFSSTGDKMGLTRVLKEIQGRDRKDRTRREGPLRRPKGAFLINTSELTILQTIDTISTIIKLKGKGAR